MPGKGPLPVDIAKNAIFGFVGSALLCITICIYAWVRRRFTRSGRKADLILAAIFVPIVLLIGLLDWYVIWNRINTKSGTDTIVGTISMGIPIALTILLLGLHGYLPSDPAGDVLVCFLQSKIKNDRLRYWLTGPLRTETRRTYEIRNADAHMTDENDKEKKSGADSTPKRDAADR